MEHTSYTSQFLGLLFSGNIQFCELDFSTRKTVCEYLYQNMTNTNTEFLLVLLRKRFIEVSDLPTDIKILLYNRLSKDCSNSDTNDTPKRCEISRRKETLPYMGNFKRPIRSRKIETKGNSHTIHMTMIDHKY